MPKKAGANGKDLRLKNRALILQLVAKHSNVSRVKLAEMTGLTKATVGNLVAELIAMNMICELDDTNETSCGHGRRPTNLCLSFQAPCICGMLIKRSLLQVILADLNGNIIDSADCQYGKGVTADFLPDQLLSMYQTLKERNERAILAVGIASVGPIDRSNGIILNPPFFFGLQNIAIKDSIAEGTGLPTYLINDANAGSVAEKMYGNGVEVANFLYLHIMNGIGAGLVLENNLYNGDMGQSGEIGHTSINYSGPICVCGNTGCLELYASLESMQQRAAELISLYPGSKLQTHGQPTWNTIVDYANQKDPLAILVLDDFCKYISFALVNSVNMLDISHIFVGYSATTNGTILEELLHRQVSSRVIYSKYRDIKIQKSRFEGDAPLIGSVAFVVDKVFRMELPYAEEI